MLSHALATSPATLKRRLHEAQHSVDELVWFERCFLARLLLDDCSLSVEEVAAQVGYASASKFSMRFRAEVGQTPTQWRATRPQQPTLEFS